MNRKTAGAALGAAILLSACASPAQEQASLRKAGYDAISTLGVTQRLALIYLRNPAADPAIRARIRHDSAVATQAAQGLGADLASPNPIPALEVSAATAAIAALQGDMK